MFEFDFERNAPAVSEQIMDTIYEAVQVWDLEGRLIYANTQTFRLFETTQKEIDTLSRLTAGWSFFDSDGTSQEMDPLLRDACRQQGLPQPERELRLVHTAHVKWAIVSAKPVHDNAGRLKAVATTLLDITRYKNEELRYKSIANYDPLTKLPNRSLLADRLHLAISHAERNNKMLAVCLIDLDGFKDVNDRLGHEAGDKVLVEVADRMQEVIRSDDTIARLGGDEFVVILTDLSKADDCAVSLYRLLNVLSEPYLIGEHRVDTVSASIGVSLYPDDKVEADTLIRHADMAMYKSKNSGKNKFSFFDVTSDQKVKANYRTINKIKKALATGEFTLYYQPKINALETDIVEVEALARWRHPLLGIVSPAEFLPLIENDAELTELFERWVVSEAIRQLHRWHEAKLFLKICINISPRQFKSRNFVNWLKEIVRSSGVPMELLSFLEIEILETAAVESLVRSNEIIQECKQLGITFALDDFGTGYSSLMHLKDLKIDTIKIDRLFVSGMLEQSANMVIVQAVVALANAFDISVTAEGAESIEHVMSLLEMGCDSIQGYAIARPMAAEEVMAFVKTYEPDPRWKMASHLLPSKADFEVLLAASNHQYWVERVFKFLSSDHIDEDALVLDSQQCRFGQWFEKAKSRKYRNLPSLRQLQQAHEKLHAKVRQIVETLKRESRRISDAEKEEVMQISKEMMHLLDTIRDEVAKMKIDNNLINKILLKRNQLGK